MINTLLFTDSVTYFFEFSKKLGSFCDFFKPYFLKPHKVLTLQRDGINHQKIRLIDFLKSILERTSYKLSIVLSRWVLLKHSHNRFITMLN